MFSKLKSVRGNKVAQVVTNARGYNQFYPLKSKGLAESALMMFIHDAGIPQTIVSDGAQEEVHGDFKATYRRFHVKQEQVVPYSPWANLAEASI
jgi:hypothetical protein